MHSPLFARARQQRELNDQNIYWMLGIHHNMKRTLMSCSGRCQIQRFVDICQPLKRISLCDVRNQVCLHVCAYKNRNNNKNIKSIHANESSYKTLIQKRQENNLFTNNMLIVWKHTYNIRKVNYLKQKENIVH